MKLCGVLFTTLLVYFVGADDIDTPIPVARHLNSRIRRQNPGGDPNLEGIFGQQNGNVNPPQFGNGQSGQSGQSSSSNERPQFGFGFSGIEQGSSNSNGGSGFDNFGSNQNQGSSGNGGFNNFGSNQNQGSSGNGGFNNFGTNQGGFGNPGNQRPSGNNQGSSSSGTNFQGGQRPQTTQRTPLNQISLQTTISDGDCLRGCRNRLPQQYSPICGSDNVSYINRQVFDCYKRECRQNVTVVYSGSCITTRAPN